MNLYKRISFFLIMIQPIISFGQDINNTFECNEYFVAKNPDWNIAYDNVKYSDTPLIIKSKDSVWGVIYPGSLTLNKDTIYVNEENGYSNRCLRIGKLKMGDSLYINSVKKKQLFLIINDTTVKYGVKTFIKSKIPVMNGCWCKWDKK